MITLRFFAQAAFFMAFFANFLLVEAQAEDWHDDTYALKVDSSTPRMHLLGHEFLLIEDISVPKSINTMRNRWRTIQKDHKQDIFRPGSIPLKGPHKEQWKALLKITKNSSDNLKTLRNINGFFNKIMSAKDDAFYGQKEYWASPKEFLSHNRGDCEDYAIAKYYALQYVGWDAKDLWVVFLRDKARDSGHAVLVAKTKKKEFVLDNLSKPAHLLIPAEQYAKQVIPFALANAEGLWMRVHEQEKPKSSSRTQ